MPIARGYAVQRLTLSTSAWTAVNPTISCSKVVIENGDMANAIMVRTDTDDGGTEKSLPAGLELAIESPVCAFEPGFPVCFLQVASGTGPAIVSFTR